MNWSVLWLAFKMVLFIAVFLASAGTYLGILWWFFHHKYLLVRIAGGLFLVVTVTMGIYLLLMKAKGWAK